MPLPRSRSVVPVWVGHLDALRPIERRHLYFSAERHGREVHRDLAEQIQPFAPEERVLVHVNDDVEVSCRAAAHPCFAFTLKPDLLAIGNPRRNLDAELPLARDAPFAVAGVAWLRDHASGPAALGTRSRDGEESLREPDLALPLALRACGGRGPRLRAGAAAGLARFVPRNLDGGRGALGRFIERDLEVVAEIAAALRSAAPLPAKQVAKTEHVAEDVAEVELVEDRRIEAAARSGLDARVAEAIVLAALVRVGEDGVRLGALLEMFLGRLVAGVAVGVVLHRLLAIGALDLAVARVPRHAEDFVVVPLAHALATFTIAGRSSRSPMVYPRRNSPVTSPSR